RNRRLLPLGVFALFLAAGCLGAESETAGPSDKSKPVPGKDGPVHSRPVVLVEAVYPGANAQVVADTVAAPVEQQVNGVEGMLHMTSRCTNEGAFTLAVTFRPGTDLAQAVALVQKRVNLALPILPDVVKQSGVSVKQRPAALLLFVKVYS